MLTVLGGLAEFERDLIRAPHRRRAGQSKGARASLGRKPGAHTAPEARGDSSARARRGDACRDRPQQQRERLDEFETHR